MTFDIQNFFNLNFGYILSDSMFPVRNSNLCPSCGSLVWRHKSSCPVLKIVLANLQIKSLITSNEIFGSSPPAIVVGEDQYPNINAGILLPPETGDTMIFDAPKAWYQQRMGLEDIFQYRISLVNAKKRFENTSARNPDKYLGMIQEIAASSLSLDTEVTLKNKPRIALYFDPHAPPYGPTGLLEKARITENPKIERKVDYVTSDTDLKAVKGVNILYKEGYDVYHISKILSVGLLGLKIQRKLVPTKWSITATDSIIINNLLKEVKHYNLINEFRIYEGNYLGNYFEIILVPTQWMFEQIEMAVAGGPWTQGRKEPIITTDYEFYWGRKTYAENVAGGYYAAEVAVLDFLESIKRQAGVLIVREIRPEYYAPIGVWKVREIVRDALKKKPIIVENINEAIRRIDTLFMTKSSTWKKYSKILDSIYNQKKLSQFIK